MADPKLSKEVIAEALWNKALEYAAYLQNIAPHFIAEKALRIAAGPGTLEERRMLVRAHNVYYTGGIIGAITIGLRAKCPSACTVIASAAFQEKDPKVILRKAVHYAELGVEFQAEKTPEILQHFREYRRRDQYLWVCMHRDELPENPSDT